MSKQTPQEALDELRRVFIEETWLGRAMVRLVEWLSRRLER